MWSFLVVNHKLKRAAKAVLHAYSSAGKGQLQYGSTVAEVKAFPESHLPPISFKGAEFEENSVADPLKFKVITSTVWNYC